MCGRLISLLGRVFLMASLFATAGDVRGQPKAAVPDAEAQEAAREKAGEIYSDRFKQAKTAADKTALAADMMNTALEVGDGSAGQYVLLKIARDVAAGAGDVKTALQAVERLAQQFDVPGLELQAETVLTAARRATTIDQRKAVADEAISIIGQLADADEYELGLKLCETAQSSAQRAKLYALAKTLSDKAAQLRKGEKQSRGYREALAVMESNPTDPDANLAAGQYLCFVKGDWDRGLPMLALGSDAELKAAATNDLRNPESAQQQVAIGDAWWDLAQSQDDRYRNAMMLRARVRYRRALASLEGLDRVRVQKRIEQLHATVPDAEPSEPIPVGEVYCFTGEVDGAFSPDGRRIVTSSRDNALRLWDVATRREIRRFAGHTTRPRMLCFAPKGDRVVSASADATIRVWDAETGRQLHTFRASTGPEKIRPQAVVAPDGKRLLWCGNDKKVRVTNLETGKEEHGFPIRHTGDNVFVVGFSQDGRWALTGGLRSTSRFWSVATGKAVDIKGKSQAYGGALSPDGQFALTGGWDKILFLWRLPQRIEVARFHGHGGHIYAAAFSADGRRILSGDGNGEVRLWDTKTAEELHFYRGHNRPISRVCFSPDGRYGLSSGDDGTVRLLGLPP